MVFCGLSAILNRSSAKLAKLWLTVATFIVKFRNWRGCCHSSTILSFTETIVDSKLLRNCQVGSSNSKIGAKIESNFKLIKFFWSKLFAVLDSILGEMTLRGSSFWTFSRTERQRKMPLGKNSCQYWWHSCTTVPTVRWIKFHFTSMLCSLVSFFSKNASSRHVLGRFRSWRVLQGHFWTRIGLSTALFSKKSRSSARIHCQS